MSGSLNKVILIGNLGKDPELKMTPGGQPLARFSVATTETWKNAQGEKQSKTEWHNIVVWGKQAEIAEKYLRKGKQVLIEGRIQYREYQAQDGTKKYATDIRCDNFQMLGKMEGEGGGAYAGAGASGGSRGGYNQGKGGYGGGQASAPDTGGYDDMPPPPSGGFDDDIPF